ncbi:MAG TPA: competence/damage-inducible protein A [Chloroflexota bacterium]
MKGEILSVGTELLLGHLVDTNAPWLAESLSELGVDVYWISQVGDNQDRLVQTLRRAWDRSDLIVISGGLGPTGDDLTRESIAELLGEEMVVQPDLEADLRAFFARRGRPMPDQNVKQATLIPSSTALANPIGTAPGWWVQRDGRVIVAMPGVPVEMKRMWSQEALPRLGKLAGGWVILSRTLKTLGIGESQAEQELKELTYSANPTVATYAKEDGVHIRITAKAKSAETAAEMVAAVEAKARTILGEHVYGIDAETVPDALARLLATSGRTLGTMESGTGGQLSATLTTAASGGAVFAGGLLAHTAGTMVRLGVDEALVTSRGTVSVEVAKSMAAAARSGLQTSAGLAVVCGMEQQAGSEKTMGVVHAALDVDGETESVSNRYSTTMRDLRRRAVLDAMDLLRRRLISDARPGVDAAKR